MNEQVKCERSVMDKYEKFAADWHLVDYPYDWTFDKLLEYIRTELDGAPLDEDAPVQPTAHAEDWGGGYLAEEIKSLAETIKEFVAEV